MFVRRLLIDVAVGVENRYRRPLAGGGVHLAFLKLGRFFIGAPGMLIASAPEWTEVTVLTETEGDQQAPRRTRAVVLQRQATAMMTQSVSWQVMARPYGYFYISLVATKRLPIVDSRWDPAIAFSFTPR